MQVAITCRHGHISDESRELITTKSEKLLRLFERVLSIDVTLTFEGDHVTAEIQVNAEHKHDFVASVTDDDVLRAFDQANHKMEQQIRKYKEKIQDHRRDVPLSDLSGQSTETD